MKKSYNKNNISDPKTEAYKFIQQKHCPVYIKQDHISWDVMVSEDLCLHSFCSKELATEFCKELGLIVNAYIRQK